jgi:hypothetical protein
VRVRVGVLERVRVRDGVRDRVVDLDGVLVCVLVRDTLLVSDTDLDTVRVIVADRETVRVADRDREVVREGETGRCVGCTSTVAWWESGSSANAVITAPPKLNDWPSDSRPTSSVCFLRPVSGFQLCTYSWFTQSGCMYWCHKQWSGVSV